MIVVTGLGRSGTSLLAQIYKELGFDPGGSWDPEWRAGFEAPDVVEVNQRIARELGMGSLGVRPRSIGKALHKSLRRVRKGRSPFHPRLDAPARWDRFGLAAERYGAVLRELADAHAVVKDPRFSHTLRVWAAAGADIKHVLVTLRPVDAVARSRRLAGYAGNPDAVRNALVYRVGLLISTLHEYDIDHDVVAFPRFIQRPDALFEAMRFPRPIAHEQFMSAFRRTVQEDMVTELRKPIGANTEQDM